MGEYSKLDSVKTIGGRGKINAIWWNIKINLQKLVDICGCELPTNLKNFMQTDLTKVKISLKGLRGYFFETPGICYERIVIIFRMICLSVFLFGMHLLGNYWMDLAEILHSAQVCPSAASRILVAIAPRVPPGEPKMYHGRDIVSILLFCMICVRIFYNVK